MTNAQIAALVQRLLPIRELRIITNVPDPARKTNDPRDPAFNVQYAVTEIAPYHDGLFQAKSDEGAWTIGALPDLIVRLVEWRYYDPAAPETTRARALTALERLAR